jgi:hypothetical protein
MTISAEKRYEFVTGRLQYHNEKIIEAFKLFIQVISAIVGGAIWLSLVKEPPKGHENYWLLADILVVCLAAMTTITVIANVIAWFGYRTAEHELNPKAPKPRHFWSYWNELAMLAVIVIASGLFIRFNPL